MRGCIALFSSLDAAADLVVFERLSYALFDLWICLPAGRAKRRNKVGTLAIWMLRAADAWGRPVTRGGLGWGLAL